MARKNGIAKAFLCASFSKTLILVCLENACICLNHNQTTTYFNPVDEDPFCLPHTLEEWTAAGPR